MKIQYLGTAAAEGIPAIFCECEVCKKAKRLGGRHVRTRSQALIDDSLLIDFPADTYMHYLKYDVPLYKIKSCLITHSHMDHLYPEDIFMRKPNFSHINDMESMSFYSDKAGYEMIDELINKYQIGENVVKNILIKPYVSFATEGYNVMPIRATHDPNSSPVVYLVEKDGKVLFYANDTSDFNYEGWENLKRYGKKINLLSMDCSKGGTNYDYAGHMSLDQCDEMREKLIKIGLVDKNTIVVLNHFSHNDKYADYEDFCNLADKRGFITSYDGMIVEF